MDDVDRSLHEVVSDKIRKYRADYNNNPPHVSISFIPDIDSTSGRLHSEFVRLLFLQAHRENDRFFAASRVDFLFSFSRKKENLDYLKFGRVFIKGSLFSIEIQ